MFKSVHKLALLLALGTCSLTQAAVIGFDNQALIDIDNETNLATYRESGFAITGDAASFLTLDGIGSGGSGGLAVLSDGAVTLSAINGAQFSFAGLDAGALDPSQPGSLTITGFFANSTSVDLMFMVGELTSYMFPNWNGLTSLRLSATGDVALDSLDVNAAAVPEPASIGMVLLGFAALLGGRKAARRS